ncbi:hypothetical protein HID58_018785 [Brassica napus]|uniref:Uncharacterized protein n=1 Tax=Brassica napus TaxID=3708 RepID=A0ABQ8DAZ2_BRANA|nr:hypothetical protein HID58_018785 [Brassica napus]
MRFRDTNSKLHLYVAQAADRKTYRTGRFHNALLILKDQSFTISHIFDSNQPLPLPNFENQEGHNNPGEDVRGAGPVSQISPAGVHILLPDTSTVLTMLFLLTTEASPNYLQRMPQLRKVAPLQRSNVVAKSAILSSIQIESENERNPCDIGAASSIGKGAKHNEKRKRKMKQSEVDGDDYDADKYNEKKKGKMKQDEVEGDDYDADNINSEKENREKLAKSLIRIRNAQKIKKNGGIQWKDITDTDHWWSSGLQLLLCPGARLLLWRREPRSASAASSDGSSPASSPVIPAASEVCGARQQKGVGGHLIFASAPHTVCIIVESLTSSMQTAAAVYHLMVVLQNQTGQYMVVTNTPWKGLEYDRLRYPEWCHPHKLSAQDHKKRNHDDVLKLVEEACKELQQEA